MASNVKKIKLDANAYEMIINHALSNEKEEIMGLLIGNIEEDSTDTHKCICNIYMSLVFERVDKRADRVEISPEQLSQAAEFTERLTHELKRQIQIIGWYHSHPHITVYPSHVDINTQYTYQMLDKNFIGIIVSVFNQNKQTLTDSIEVIAFQSDEKTVNKGFIQIPIEICVSDEVFIEKNLQTLYKIPQILVQEEENAYKAHMNGNENLLCLMSNIGIHLHSMSQLIDTSYLEIIDALKCRLETNEILIKNLSDNVQISSDKVESIDEECTDI